MGEFAEEFRDLDVYKGALKLVVDVHEFCKGLPADEKYALMDQMRRASRSVCSNIAEAWRKRRYQAAFVSKLSDAETEAGEMQSWLDVSQALGYMDRNRHADFDLRYEHVIAQLICMIRDAGKWCKRR